MKRYTAAIFLLAAFTLCLPGGAVAQQPQPVVAGPNFNVNPGVADQFVGDIYLQRQVEPKIVCASNNTQLCVGIANDYRTVDMTADSLSGFGEARLKTDLMDPKTRRAAAPDAWLGLYRTSNGGRNWLNGLVPGSPVDTTDLGLRQPWSGLAAASDGALATDGVHFFGAGLFFNRGGRSMIGAFRLTAYNDESRYPIRWDTGYSHVIDMGTPTSTGKFADLPSIVVDAPRAAGQECGNVYIAYTRFAGAAGVSFIYFSRSSDCGRTYSNPVKISGTYNMTQRAVIAIDPRPGTPTTDGGGTLYAVFRTFQPDQFVFAKSTDYGKTWTKAAPVASKGDPSTLCTYDQPTVGTIDTADTNAQTARAVAFASVQVDATGRIHVVWTERVGSNGGLLSGRTCTTTAQPKIVYTSSGDKGNSWTSRKAIDAGFRCETVPTMDHAAGLDRSSPSGSSCPADSWRRRSGPQIQPSLAYSAGTLMLLYSEGRATNPVTGQFLDSSGFHAGRNTQMDIRAARIDPASGALLSTTQVSRYAIDATTNDLTTVANNKGYKAYNRPYLPQYKGGTVPFKGDHDDIVPLEKFVWDSTAHFAMPSDVPGVRFLGIWGGDNREALFPGGDIDGDWWNYVNPGSGGPSPCNAGIRNSNNYAAYIGPPIEAFVNQSFKPPFDFTRGNQDRSWVITVRNHSDRSRTVKFTLDERAGHASFDQFHDVGMIGNEPSDPYCLTTGTYPNCTAYRIILPYSSMTFTVFGTITDFTVPAPFKVNIFEANTAVTPVTETLAAIVRLNPNPNNPAPLAGNGITTSEYHGPSVEGPFVNTYANPTQGNPTQGNPTQGNPTQGNPTQGNPTQGNPTQGNAGFSDYTDYQYVVRATGANTLSGYSAFASIANAAEVDQSHLVQMIITRRHKVPTLNPSNGCKPIERVEDEVISTITVSSAAQLNPTQGNPTQGNPTQGNPTQGNPTQGNPTQGNPTQGNNTFAVAPQNAPAAGQSASATFTATAIASALAQAVSNISTDIGPDGTLVGPPDTDEVHVTIRFFHCDNGPCGPITFPDGTSRSFSPETVPPAGVETVVPRSCSSDPCGATDPAINLIGLGTTAHAGDNVAGTVTPPATVGVGADLVVSAPSPMTVTPTTVAQGGPIQIPGFTVTNQGDVTAVASSYRILAVPTTGSGPGIWLSSSINLPSIAFGGSYTVSQPAAVSTANLAPGTYSVGPYLDNQNFVAETNEFNNFAGAMLVVQATTLPVLFSVSPDALVAPGPNPGDAYSGTFVIQGQRLQGGQIYTDGPLLLVGDSSVDATGTEIQRGFTIGCCAPLDGWLGRTFNLWVGTSVGTSSTVHVLIYSPTASDLVVQSLTHYPPVPTDQDLITVTATVANVGLGAAGSSQLELCVGGETPGPTGNCVHAPVPALAAGGAYTVTREVTLTAQNYRNTATADYLNAVVESNETNNVTTDDYTVKVASGVTVSGTIYYSITGVAGAEVDLLFDPTGQSPPIRRTFTDANGSYSFPLVAPGIYGVRRWGPQGQGYITWVTSGVAVNNSNVVADLDLPKVITLSSPSNGATGVSCLPTLTWNVNPEASTYIVQVNTTAGWVLFGKFSSSVASYTLQTPLAPNVNYTWQVGAYDLYQHYVGTTEMSFTLTTGGCQSGSPTAPDLIVQSLTHYPLSPTTQDLMTVTATVANIGQTAADPSQLEICVGGETPGPTGNCQHTPVPALSPGGTYPVSREVTLSVAQNYTNTATADYLNAVPESNEGNNVTTENYTVTAASGVTVSGTIYYSATGLSGATVELLATPLTNNPPLRRTVTNGAGAYGFPLVAQGDYYVRREGPSGQGFVLVATSLTVGNTDVTGFDLDLPKLIALSSPTYGATGVSCSPTLTWTSNPQATSYGVQINETTGWVLVTHSGTFTIGLAQSSYALTTSLKPNLNYSWQVGGFDSAGHWVGTSSPFTFTTGTCSSALQGDEPATSLGPTAAATPVAAARR